ncbi:hypothetical protein, partial [Kineococcus indalonis]|uniref:hypothetical protein n=1 Tax=Kineococcus indalonis TaxID=2696566 RepID=UPI00196A6AD8
MDTSACRCRAGAPRAPDQGEPVVEGAAAHRHRGGGRRCRHVGHADRGHRQGGAGHAGGGAVQLLGAEAAGEDLRAGHVHP